MTHQAHNVHWNVLASCLKIYAPDRPHEGKPTNVYFRFEDPNQDEKIRHFVRSLSKNIKEHTACERNKYPAEFDILDENDILLCDEVTKKITPLVHKWRQSYDWKLASESDKKKPPSRELCTHNEGFECGCVLPLQERRASAFQRRYYRNSSCYDFLDYNMESFYNIEVVKTLILYGEMGPILRACAHLEVDFERWQSQGPCSCKDYDAGWDMVYKEALNAYIVLNIIYCFPELWDPETLSTRARRADYRNTKIYQEMVRKCNLSGGTSVVSEYPHKAFFGIADNQFQTWPKLKPTFALKYLSPVKLSSNFSRADYPYGQAPIEEFLHAESNESDYVPDATAVEYVMQVLYNKGLPVELVQDVMQKADYNAECLLVVSGDPFHRLNREELQKYLNYCWRTIVNCNMMAEALEIEIGWEHLIYEIILNQISSPRGRKIVGPR